MDRRVIILFSVLAFTAAMVPRQRRAADTQEDGKLTEPQTSTTEKPAEICAPQTPCAWTVYRGPHIFDFNFTNTYCICGPDTICRITDDDSSANAYIHRCRDPADEDPIDIFLQTDFKSRF